MASRNSGKEEMNEVRVFLEAITGNVEKVIVGKRPAIELVLI